MIRIKKEYTSMLEYLHWNCDWWITVYHTL